MKIYLQLLIFISLSAVVSAKTLHVGNGQRYSTLSAAAESTDQGDTILVHGGIYSGGEFIENLQGSRDNWIAILAVPGEEVVFEGGTEAWHLTDVAWLYIRGFEFRGQRGNGVNIDDGGSYETPSHHVVIDECYFHDMDASGNNDLLKLSGLDSFEIQDCRFENGASGGSGADMVGCHYGLFRGNHFEEMGSNAIQAKGGTQHIRFERNMFINAGQRSINLGGSTGLEFFRPIDARFEAADLQVFSNIFVGSVAPIAYVGSVRVEVINNTIWLPENWVLRILQETVDETRFASCGDNIFRNNLVVVDSRLSRDVNIGPNTRPESFLFSNNLWYHLDNPAWNGPVLPVSDLNSVISQDPQLFDPLNGDFNIPENSPAVAKGFPVAHPSLDYVGNRFQTSRSIGAIEGGEEMIGSVELSIFKENSSVKIYPNPAGNRCVLTFNLRRSANASILLYDMSGKVINTLYEGQLLDGDHDIHIELPKDQGMYVVQLQLDKEFWTTSIINLGEKDG